MIGFAHACYWSYDELTTFQYAPQFDIGLGTGHCVDASIQDAARYMAPNSGCFIRACESGVYRSLSERELTLFLLI